MHALILSILLPAAAAAQMTGIAPGAPVRGVIPVLIPEPVSAIFVAATNDSVWLRNARGRTTDGVYFAPRIALATSQVRQLDVRIRVNRVRGAQVGFLTGLAAGAVVFGATAVAAPDSYAMLGAGFLALVLPPVTTIIGAAIGSEEWRRVVPAPRS
jgi:hypothetical protein